MRTRESRNYRVFVWRMEKGERRLDVVEFYSVCECLGADADALYSELVGEFKKLKR